MRIASTRCPTRGWGGPRVVAISRRVKSKKLGSPIQLCVWGPAYGVLSFFCTGMLSGLFFRPRSPG